MKKKRALLAFTAALCMSTAVAGFVACGEETHTHADVDPKDGVCDVCGEALPAAGYTVAFETNGGNALPKQGVKAGEKAQKPEDPVRAGFIFDGWFRDEGLTNPFDFSAPVNGETTLYARWKEAAATEEKYFEFAEVDGGVSIAVKLGETLPEDVVLPSEHGGKAVVAIAQDGFLGQPAMRGVRIPASVISIGRQAFRECAALNEVTGGENVEEIAYGAFAGTPWDMNLSVGEVYLGKTFYRYAGSLYVDTQIEIEEGAVGIAAGAFEGIEHLVGVTLPASLENIGNYAFFGTNLLSVTVKSVTPPALGVEAFGTLGGKIYVPLASLENYRGAWTAYRANVYEEGIEDRDFVVTFDVGTGASNAPAAQTVKGFGKATAPTTEPTKTGVSFGGWYKDSACTVPFDFDAEITENTTVYARFGVYYTVTFVTEEGVAAPAAQKLEEGARATLPEAPEKEGYEFMGWFRDQALLLEYDFRDPVRSALNLYAKFLPDGANYTGEDDGWTIVDGRVQSYTGSATEIVIPAALSRLDSITDIVGEPTNARDPVKNITSITVADGNESFKIEDGALLSKDGTVLYFLFTQSRTYRWPEVRHIGDYAFYKYPIEAAASNIAAAMTFSDELQSVGDYAFYGSTGLTDYSKFRTVESVGYYAFGGHQFQTIEGDLKYVANRAFARLNKQNESQLTKIVLHKIRTIGGNAFNPRKMPDYYDSYHSYIKEIVIGPEIESLGAAAFAIAPEFGEAGRKDTRIIFEGDNLLYLRTSSTFGTNAYNDDRSRLKVYVKPQLFEQMCEDPSYLGLDHGFYTEDRFYIGEFGTVDYYDGDKTNVTLPKEVKTLENIFDIFADETELASCTAFAVAPENEAFMMKDGALLSKDGKTLYAYFGNGEGDFSSVTEVKPYAFYGRLTGEKTPKFGKLELVGEYAFANCTALTDYTPFADLETIAPHTFDGAGFTEIALRSAALTTIGDGAFANTASLTKVTVRLLTPPTVAADAFAETTNFYVPTELVETYKETYTALAERIFADEATHVYTVTFDAGEEEPFESYKLLTQDRSYQPEGEPEKEGFFFEGWSLDPDRFVAYNFGSAIEADVTLYAMWTEGVVVTFDAGENASEVQKQTLRPGTFATEPEAPVWEGYVFGGWYKDTYCRVPFDFAKDEVTSDVILYGKWSQGYVVSFDTEGGSTVSSQSVLAGGKALRPEENPSRDGYKFAGWFLDAAHETPFDFDSYVVDSSIELHAKWDEDFWKVDENGKLLKYYGPYDTVELSEVVKSIDSILDIFETGANFLQCTEFDLAEGSAFRYESGALLSPDGTVLYAFFGSEETALSYPTVTEIGAYAFYGKLTAENTLTFSEDIATIGDSAFENSKLTSFAGFENVKSIGTNGFMGSGVTAVTWNVEGTVPAVFQNCAALKTVILMNCTSVAADAFKGCKLTTVVLGEKVTSLGARCFSTSATTLTSLTVYALSAPNLGSSVSNNTHPLGGDPHKKIGHIYVPAQSLAVYRKATGWNWYSGSSNGELFEAITVKVTYDMGTEEIEAPNIPTANWGGVLQEPATPMWKGHVFDGWYLNEGLTDRVDFEAFIYEDTKLWAKWVDGFWVEFVTGEDADQIAWQAVRPGQNAIEPTEPRLKGSLFDGWFRNEGCTGDPFEFGTAINENITLHAKWLKGHLVEFFSNGGSAVDWQTVLDGAKIVEPEDPTLRNNIFEGWYDNEECEGEPFDFESEIKKDTKLYAKWNPWTVNEDGSVKTYAGDKNNIKIPLNVTKLTSICDILGSRITSWPSGEINISVVDNHPAFKVENGALLSADGKTLYFYFGTETTYENATVETLIPYCFGRKATTVAHLTSVTLSNENLTVVPEYAFYNEANLASVTFGAKMTEVGQYAFNGCGITSFDFSELESIEYYAFSNTKLTEIELPKVTSIGQYAFYQSAELKSVNAPSVTSVGSYAFNNCSKLTSFTFDNVDTISTYVFQNTALTEVNLPKIQTIGSSAFRSIKTLTKVTIGEECTSLGTYAFAGGATDFTVTMLGTTPPTGASQMFGTSSTFKGKILVPAEAVEDYQTKTQWSTYAKFIEASEA